MRRRLADHSLSVPGTSKTKAPEQTFEEARYLRKLAEDRVPIRVRLTDNSEVQGIIEFYDVSFIRLTREGEPNLFLFKHDIKYLYEASSTETRTTERGGVSEKDERTPPRPVR
jgi:sRNA-binding regulator protein Hfq